MFLGSRAIDYQDMETDVKFPMLTNKDVLMLVVVTIDLMLVLWGLPVMIWPPWRIWESLPAPQQIYLIVCPCMLFFAYVKVSARNAKAGLAGSWIVNGVHERTIVGKMIHDGGGKDELEIEITGRRTCKVTIHDMAILTAGPFTGCRTRVIERVGHGWQVEVVEGEQRGKRAVAEPWQMRVSNGEVRAGCLSANGTKIYWSNNEVWRRKGSDKANVCLILVALASAVSAWVHITLTTWGLPRSIEERLSLNEKGWLFASLFLVMLGLSHLASPGPTISEARWLSKRTLWTSLAKVLRAGAMFFAFYGWVYFTLGTFGTPPTLWPPQDLWTNMTNPQKIWVVGSIAAFLMIICNKGRAVLGAITTIGGMLMAPFSWLAACCCGGAVDALGVVGTSVAGMLGVGAESTVAADAIAGGAEVAGAAEAGVAGSLAADAATVGQAAAEASAAAAAEAAAAAAAAADVGATGVCFVL